MREHWLCDFLDGSHNLLSIIRRLRFRILGRDELACGIWLNARQFLEVESEFVERACEEVMLLENGRFLHRPR